MVPVSLFIWIALEIAIYLALGRLAFAAPWSLVVAGTLGGMLGVRAGINGITWMFGMAFASPAPRLGFTRTARLMVDEYLAFLLSFVLIVPFERLWMPADRLRCGRQPILLVHGYGCSRGVWWLLRRRLEAAGHTVATISLVPPYVSIERMVPQLQSRIEAVCAATGSRQLTLIAHSMGGLVARACIARHGSERIARLITLATPHAGTELARIGLGANAREMEPGSAWLQALPEKPGNVPVIALRNPYDNYCMPQENQRLAGARDIELPAVGHLAMLYDRRVADLLINALASPESPNA